MSNTEKENYPHPSHEEFASLLDDVLKKDDLKEGRVVKGKVIQIENDHVIIHVGLKTEGRVPIKEFSPPIRDDQIRIGDEVEVYVEQIENMLDEAVLSCDKARRENVWQELEKAHLENQNVKGTILAHVKGGFTVDLSGAQAFLPGSQIDTRPLRDLNGLVDQVQLFQILKIDKHRNNIVVSRRAVMEENRAEERNKMLENLEEGQIMEGTVKNITDYGAFIDLGGIDGLLHVTQVSWRRVEDLSKVLELGDKIKVKIIRINHETRRLNLSMKHLEADPWEKINEKYQIGSKVTGQITNITDYGAFVEMEPGIEGLVHVSEMSWLKKNVQPAKIVSVGEEVKAVVLDIDIEKRRISLGMKQNQVNPWEAFLENHPIGTKIKGEITNLTDFGLFIALESGLDGMVHISDISWDEPGEEAIKQYRLGERVEVVVLSVEVEKERIALGIKQISSSDLSALKDMKKGDIVTCTVLEAKDSGIDIEIGQSGVRAFIRRGDLAREYSEQRPERFAPNEKVDAQITQLDLKKNKITLSIKAMEIAADKEAVEQYGSTDSGASLGNILGGALGLRWGRKKEAPPAKEEDRKKESDDTKLS